MKKKLKYFIMIFLVSIFIISILMIAKITRKSSIELTQLSPQSSSQMMGYILKTKNNKLIIIDGGTIQDTQNLMKYIN